MIALNCHTKLAELLGENASEAIVGLMFTPAEVRLLAAAGEGGVEPDSPLAQDLYRSGYLLRGEAKYVLASWRDVLYQYLLSPRYARQPAPAREIFRQHFLERNLRRFRAAQAALFRVLPAGGTLDHLDLHVVVPHSVAAGVLAAAGQVVAIDCVCRVAVANCGQPRDVCLALGEGAEYYRERGLGRSLGQEEAQALLARAAAAGLVHCTDNPAMRQPSRVICSCCGCCCVFVRGLKEYSLPRTIASAGYLAVTAGGCDGCGECVDRCIFDARELVDGEICLTPDKCFGCGQCALACPAGAVRLEPAGG